MNVATATSQSYPAIRVSPTEASRIDSTDLSSVAFSTVFSDHMFVAEYYDGRWQDAEIRPYGPLSLFPNILALQYAVSVFEGLKALRTPDNEIALFRPTENAKRINRSAARLAMPEIPEAFFMEALHRLIEVDSAWVPPSGTGALYVRPFYISTDPSVRPKPGERFLFVIFTLPFSSYYAAPVKALVSERYVRAFPGGTGDVKPGGNYAPALVADVEAKAAGCDTVLWLDGIEHKYIDECGVMNVFIVLDNGSGPKAVTPPLGGTILPGVTRDSVIALLRDMGIPVEERRISIDEVIAAQESGELKEAFGTGTAATLSHIQSIVYRGRTIEFPSAENRVIATAVRDRLVGIQGGRAPDKFGWLDRL